MDRLSLHNNVTYLFFENICYFDEIWGFIDDDINYLRYKCFNILFFLVIIYQSPKVIE